MALALCPGQPRDVHGDGGGIHARVNTCQSPFDVAPHGAGFLGLKVERETWTKSFLDLEFIGPGASTMYTFNVLCVLIIAVIAVNLPHQPHRVRRVKSLRVRF